MIRTGYGRGYDLGIFGSIFGHNVTQNLPVLGIQTLRAGQQFRYRVHAGAGTDASRSEQHSGLAAEGPERPAAAAQRRNAVRDLANDAAAHRGRLEFHHPAATDAIRVSLEAAYVGNKGTHVFAGTGGDYDPNQADSRSVSARSPRISASRTSRSSDGARTFAITPATQATTTTRCR